MGEYNNARKNTGIKCQNTTPVTYSQNTTAVK